MDDLNPYLDLALEAADKASAFIRQESEKTLEVGYKGDTDLVTHVDLGSEKIIKELLKSKFPEHQILAEEGGADRARLHARDAHPKGAEERGLALGEALEEGLPQRVRLVGRPQIQIRRRARPVY